MSCLPNKWVVVLHSVSLVGLPFPVVVLHLLICYRNPWRFGMCGVTDTIPRVIVLIKISFIFSWPSQWLLGNRDSSVLVTILWDLISFYSVIISKLEDNQNHWKVYIGNCVLIPYFRYMKLYQIQSINI